MGHYFCVAITEEPKFSSVCNLLNDFLFDNDTDESDGIFDYYTFNYHQNDMVAVKHGSRGYVEHQMKLPLLLVQTDVTVQGQVILTGIRHR